MTEKDIAKRMRTEYEKEMPDMLSGIEAACKNAPQVRSGAAAPPRRGHMTRWIGALAACFLIFFGGLFAGTLVPRGADPVAPSAVQTVYMDVNPSVELRVDENGRVLECIAGNEEAETLLTDLSLVGVERDTALTAVLGAMYLHGYLDNEHNAVLISVDGDSTDVALREITDKINDVFEGSSMSCSIIAQPLSVNDELTARAEEYGVSPGKLHLIEKLISGLDSLEEKDISALASLSVGELNLMYTAGVGENEDFGEDIVSGELSGYVGREEAIAAILRRIGENSSLLDEYEVVIDYEDVDGELRMVYIISMRFRYSDNFYSFTIDCKSGDLIETDFELNIPW